MSEVGKHCVLTIPYDVTVLVIKRHKLLDVKYKTFYILFKFSHYMRALDELFK